MSATIEVTPRRDRRREFAAWTNRHGRARTASANSFAVPTVVFPEIPEELLLGAVIDGQPYQPTNAVPKE